MSSLRGEILSIKTIEKMTKTERELEKAKRAKNIIELELVSLKKYYEKLLKEVEYLREREATLTAIEKSLPQRIKTYEEKNAPLVLIKELELWENMLEEEKEKLLQKIEKE